MNPARGTTVRLTLPPAAQPAPTADSVAPDDRRRRAALAATSEARVLVVDDDKLVRRFMADVAAEPRLPRDRRRERRRRRSTSCDATASICCVVDFAMPGMNGAEVARAAQIDQPGLQVLIVSGYADSAAVEAALGTRAPATQTVRPRRARRSSGGDRC